MFAFHLLIVTCWSVTLANSQAPDMYGLINILYQKADPSFDGKIYPENLTDVYLALDVNNTGFVTKEEFVQGWVGISYQSTDMAQAYFDLSDVDGDGRIDANDTREIFQRFDADANGYISDQEFVAHFVTIYFTAPFVVLYRRLAAREGVHGGVDRKQFETLMMGLKDHAADGSITKADLRKDWVAETFGTARDADKVMSKLDGNGDDVISKDELGAVFDRLDKGDTGKIGFDQIRAVYLVFTKPDETIIG